MSESSQVKFYVPDFTPEEIALVQQIPPRQQDEGESATSGGRPLPPDILGRIGAMVDLEAMQVLTRELAARRQYRTLARWVKDRLYALGEAPWEGELTREQVAFLATAPLIAEQLADAILDMSDGKPTTEKE